MNQQPHFPASGDERDQRYNGFWPVLLISCSLVVVFAWEIRVGVFARQNAERLRDQQVRVVEQAKKV